MYIRHFTVCVQITELEAQCNEADQEKQKNAQLSVRVQELEAEINEKQQVRRTAYCHTQYYKVSVWVSSVWPFCIIVMFSNLPIASFKA